MSVPLEAPRTLYAPRLQRFLDQYKIADMVCCRNQGIPGERFRGSLQFRKSSYSSLDDKWKWEKDSVRLAARTMNTIDRLNSEALKAARK